LPPGRVGVVPLWIHDSAQRLDGRQLVAAEATVQQLLLARADIEVPAPIGTPPQRDGLGPIILAHLQHRAVRSRAQDRMFRRIGDGEALQRGAVLHRVAGADQAARPLAQHAEQAALVLRAAASSAAKPASGEAKAWGGRG